MLQIIPLLPLFRVLFNIYEDFTGYLSLQIMISSLNPLTSVRDFFHGRDFFLSGCSFVTVYMNSYFSTFHKCVCASGFCPRPF